MGFGGWAFSSVGKRRSLLLSLGLTHELGNMVKLAQEIVRERLVFAVSLSFLNLSCVNVNFGVKLHGAVGLRASRLGGTDVLLARDSYAGAPY